MTQLKNYWTLPYKAQEEIKTAHPIVTLTAFQVTGRANLTWFKDNQYGGVGTSVNTTVIASTPESAAEQVLNGYRAFYEARSCQVTSTDWLNDGPQVIPL